MTMLIISFLVFLTTSLAFVSKISISRKSTLFRNEVVFSSVDGEEILERSELQELFWITPEGLSIEVLAKYARLLVEKKPVNERVYGSIVRFFKRITNNAEKRVKIKQKAPILFIHGSFHAAWCYEENYLDFFSELGHQCYAISLRGTSTTGMPPLDPGEVVRMEQHVSDVKCALSSMKASMSDRMEGMDIPDPIIISHSFGGLIVMKLLEEEEIRKRISGACFLCSVPPSGNGPMTQRFIKSKFLSSLKIVWGFVFKAATNNLPTCRELFFDKTVPSDDIEKYMVHFRADSRVSLDLRSLDAILPSAVSMDIEGRAYWLPPIDTADCSDFSLNNEISNESSTYVADDISGVRIDMDSSTIGIIPRLQRTSIPRICPSILVVGAEKDFVVDQEGVEETARFLGVKPIFIPEGYHDVMLGPKWRLSADVIAKWLQSV